MEQSGNISIFVTNLDTIAHVHVTRLPQSALLVVRPIYNSAIESQTNGCETPSRPVSLDVLGIAETALTVSCACYLLIRRFLIHTQYAR